jgi:3',5'-cyclic AMP phosphodiesterase CpdA
MLLAHLSDIHLPHAGRIALRDLNAKRALGAANWRRNRVHVHLRSVLDRIVDDMRAQRPDHIAVTGDVVNFGLPAEHAAALDWLATLGPPERVSVVPGNHDSYVVLRRDEGYRRWRDYMGNSGGGSEAIEAEGFPYVRRLGAVGLVGVASGVPTPLLVSSGELGADQRRALGRALDLLRSENRTRVMLIHHPPLRYRGYRRTGLRDTAGVLEILAQHGAEVLLHGHYHRNTLATMPGRDGPVPMVGAASASAAIRHHGDLASYNLLRIGEGESRVIECVTRGMQFENGPIVEIARHILGRPHTLPTPSPES